ncbi:GerMN domain-containing protein [Tepidibacter hydrothermalis]|uniref:GerMN domain-containing protein n=1 Tax=Tepidibacter hydrothermalis TaxID=3036126 RepID=A0ABY8EIP8_9FIRM|nr:GerMN domain-containing protein [Tepidibacter hydrothermalis]WFD11547.1 GerMN domain-containing protein [Tepidibacter hydrothermalis]
MRKKIYFIIMISVLMIFAAGCNNKASNSDIEKEEVKLYYTSNDNSKINWITRPIEYINDEKYEATLKALLNGPYSSDMVRSINEKTKILSINKKSDVLYIDLSKEFFNFKSDVDEVNSVITISNTLNQFEEINGIEIKIEGKDLISPDGERYGLLKEFDLTDEKSAALTLYLPDENLEYLVPIKKNVVIKEGEIIGEKVIQELINESDKQGYNVVPKGTKLLNYSQDNGIATVDLSQEFIKNSSGGSIAQTMAIYSIVSSLTEFENINSVLFLIDGKSVEDFSHYEFNKPFSRDESLIKH